MTESDSVKRDGEKAPRGGRRNGSILAAVLCAGLLFVAIVVLDAATLPNLQDAERPIDTFAIAIFILVLLWWAVSPSGADVGGKWRLFIPGRNWGIGEPTITMVVTVLTAAVAVVTLVHEFFKKS